MKPLNNPFLAQVMAQVRRDRPLLDGAQPFFNRVEKVRSGNYVEVWFMTGGCTWDHQGGCTMCNYGRGHALGEEETVAVVREALAAVTVPVSELLVSPSGGMLDPHEVAPGARRRIYALLRDFPAPQVMIETRAETVTPEAIDELSAALPGRRLAVELGLESACAWVLRFCVNKGSDPEAFEHSLALLHGRGIGAYANVCVGTAFLTFGEAIEDAVRSVRWALTRGTDTVVLFPLHVKPYTLLAVMHENGRYQPPSLWSLVEVLRRLGTALLPRVEIAWYRSYYADRAKTRLSPGTCPACQRDVVGLLDSYRATQSADAVAALVALRCPCKDRWRNEVEASGGPLAQRVWAEYEWLARRFDLRGWLLLQGSRLRADLHAHAPDLTPGEEGA